MNLSSLIGLRVLLVEDEGLVSMLIEEYLDAFGCMTVGTAARLADAMEKAGRLQIDVAVLDVNFAGQVSYPVAMLLQTRGIPFVFATGYGLSALPETLRGSPLLVKPFRGPQLAAALAALELTSDR